MDYSEKLNAVIDEVSKVIVGQEKTIRLLVISLLSSGHVLLEDVPGVGKTTLAKTFAKTLSLDFARIQCTPDTLPGDIIGYSVFHQETGQFERVPGPLFHNIVLTDELNRMSPKAQAALLEAMEESQATIDGETMEMPQPFFVIATQNPVSSVGTYPLPEAELDRFFMRLSIGYPEGKDAHTLSRRFLDGDLFQNPESVLTAPEVTALQEAVKNVTVSDELVDYVNDVVSATRKAEGISCGLSPRAGLDVLRASQANALLDGRTFCIPEDVRCIFLPVASHRLILTAEARMNRVSPWQIMDRIFASVPLPE